MKWEGPYPPMPATDKEAEQWDDSTFSAINRALEEHANWLRERRRLAKLRAFSEAWNRGDIRPPRRIDIEGPGWAGPIYWLESLPRARWWAWLRKKLHL